MRTSSNSGCSRTLFHVFLIIAVVFVINYLDTRNSTPEYETTTPALYEDFAAVEEADLTVQTIESNFLLSGYVPAEAAADCIAEVADYAEDLVATGVLSSYVNDGDAVWMQHPSGLQTIYVPPTEGTLAFNTNDDYSILTMEPHDGTFEPQYDPYLYKNTEAAILMDNLSEQWVYTYAAKAESVSLSSLSNFGEDQIVFWLGHGAWSSKTGACLITGEYFDSGRYNSDKFYQELFTSGCLVRTAGSPSRVVITSKYIDTYVGSMTDSVVFLGACSSSKGVELVRSFLNKGAQAVVATSDEIRVVYYTSMMRTMVEALCTRDASGQFNTFPAALQIAKQQHGADDRGYPKGVGAKVEIFGPDIQNLRITDVIEATPVVTPTPEPVTVTPTPAPVTVDVYQTLANYASQFNYLNGTTGYTGAYTKAELRSIYSYNIPIQPIACTIADFDQDNTDELLIVDSNGNHTVHLEMYEVTSDGSVVCAAETDLQTPIAGSTEASTTEYFYFWRNGRLQICVSEFSIGTRVASGTILRCAGAVYDGNSFTSLGMAEVVGTADANDPFISDMAALGFNINLYDMLNGYTLATDYLQSCTVFCTARSMCTISDGEWMTYQDVWFMDDSVTYMEISHIGFTNDLLG